MAPLWGPEFCLQHSYLEKQTNNNNKKKKIQHVDQWNITEDLEINSRSCGHLIFNRGVKSTLGKESTFSKRCWQNGRPPAEDWVTAVSLSSHTSSNGITD